jgi:hypothetical protein
MELINVNQYLEQQVRLNGERGDAIDLLCGSSIPAPSNWSSLPAARASNLYAILSLTWGSEKHEVSFKEMTSNIESSSTVEKLGFKKIKKTCVIAREEHNLKYAWVDTCCIDKSSSAELSEAINSM